MRSALAVRRLLGFFFPRTCAVCRTDVPDEERHAFCAACRDAVPRWAGLVCAVCGLPLPDGGARCYVCRRAPRSFRACRSAGLYEGTLRQALLLLKYGGKPHLAEPLGELLGEAWLREPEFRDAQAVCAVPLNFWRRHARGYNQAELLAESFARASGVPHLTGALRRTRPTASQTQLDRERRRENVEGAFEGDGWTVKGKILLLVDDVCTTGATLDACARALREAGAKRIYGLTVARQV